VLNCKFDKGQKFEKSYPGQRAKGLFPNKPTIAEEAKEERIVPVSASLSVTEVAAMTLELTTRIYETVRKEVIPARISVEIVVP